MPAWPHEVLHEDEDTGIKRWRGAQEGHRAKVDKRRTFEQHGHLGMGPERAFAEVGPRPAGPGPGFPGGGGPGDEV